MPVDIQDYGESSIFILEDLYTREDIEGFLKILDLIESRGKEATKAVQETHEASKNS